MGIRAAGDSGTGAAGYRMEIAMAKTDFKSAHAISRPFEKLHRDGSLWAKGQTIDDIPTGYWEWFRRDGTKLRSGCFKDGKQVGKWTTYDATGKV
jgi:hypothetical protein